MKKNKQKNIKNKCRAEQKNQMIHSGTVTTSSDTVTSLQALLRPVQTRSRPDQTLSRPSRHRHDPSRHNHYPSRHCHDSFRHCHHPSGNSHNLTLPRPVQALPRLDSCSTSLPSGNQVDGLPLACHVFFRFSWLMWVCVGCVILCSSALRVFRAETRLAVYRAL